MPLTEAELLACYRRLETPLFNALYRWLWQAQDCQDLIHDAFLRVWGKRVAVDAARIDALVWTTALNLARNRLRWRALWRSGEIDEHAQAGEDASQAAARRQRDERMRAALRRLPKGLRDVLILSEFGGLDTASIATLLSIPTGTVGSRRHTALARLRGWLQEIADD
jgi:RNA polymerase sigma factor (sigma-70 family)